MTRSLWPDPFNSVFIYLLLCFCFILVFKLGPRVLGGGGDNGKCVLKFIKKGCGGKCMLFLFMQISNAAVNVFFFLLPLCDNPQCILLLGVTVYPCCGSTMIDMFECHLFRDLLLFAFLLTTGFTFYYIVFTMKA